MGITEEQHNRALTNLRILRERDPYHLTRVKDALGFNKNVVITWIRSGKIPERYVEDVIEITEELLALPLDEPSPTRNAKGYHTCVFRPNILCSDHTRCKSCGWSPEVEARRIKAWREAK